LLSNFRDLSIQTSATFVISAGEPASARAIDLQEPTPRPNNARELSPGFYLLFANDQYPESPSGSASYEYTHDSLPEDRAGNLHR